MDVETWTAIWQLVFIAASIAFYAIVVAVGIKGFGDVAQMLRNMAVHHPTSGVREFKEDVCRRPCRQQYSILPNQILIDHSVLLEDQEPLSMDMEWMLH